MGSKTFLNRLEGIFINDASSLIVLKVFRANSKSLDTIDDYLENVPRENKFHL